MNIIAFLTLLNLLWPQIREVSPDPNILQVTGAKVIFFEPSSAELDSIPQADRLELGEFLDDFDFYAGKVSVYLKRVKMPAAFTTSPVIVVKYGKNKYQKFAKKDVQELCGMILTDGVREPLLVAGAGSEKHMIAVIHEFFRLKE
jgi:hypothetical protein